MIEEISNTGEIQKENNFKANTPLVKRMKSVDFENDVRISNSTFERLCSLSEKDRSERKIDKIR